MAILTELSMDDVASCTRAFGVEVATASGVMAGSVNTNYAIVDRQGARWFLRVYEEQDLVGAARQARLLERLALDGVPTPRPQPRRDGAGFVVEVRGKPASLFPFIDGRHRCQRAVSEPDVREVGAALGRLHRVGQRFNPSEGLTGPSRFSIDALRARLEGLDAAALTAELSQDRALLDARLDALAGSAPKAPELPLIHGDLFRDNVLFGGREAVLLDFESASRGPAAFDLVVTLLAWCFGDRLDPALGRALVLGYTSARPLSALELDDIPRFAELACVRFAITRITDYELRPRGSGVYKDYRRWLARLAAVERSLGLHGRDADSTLRHIWPM